MSNMDSIKKPRMNLGAREEQVVPASYKTHNSKLDICVVIREVI